jgi:hypothetical protein
MAGASFAFLIHHGIGAVALAVSDRQLTAGARVMEF